MIEKGGQGEVDWQRWELAGSVSGPGIPMLRKEAGAWTASQVFRTPVLWGHSSALRFYHSCHLPFSSSLSFITLLPLIVHIGQNESIPQDPWARACCLSVQMAPCDGSLLFHQKHHRRNLFCTTKDMISILSAALAQCFGCSLGKE